MTSGLDSAYARYDSFFVGDSSSNYELSVGQLDPASTAGDSLASHNGMGFSTVDRDNDGSASSCSNLYSSAFWFNNCMDANPLGHYQDNTGKGVLWKTWKPSTSLDSITFKIKANQCASGSGSTCTKCKSGYYVCTIAYKVTNCCAVLLSSCEAVTISGVYEI